MTERIRRGGSAAASPEQSALPHFAEVLAPERYVTADVVDVAVDRVFSDANVSPDVARTMKSLMGSDSGSTVAQAYYHGLAAGAGRVGGFGVKRRTLEVPYSLGDEQATILQEYAPDFKLVFSSRESHDHPVAAACRQVDRALIHARLPPGLKVSHVGGAVVPLVLSGLLGHGHHACVPLVDRKDAARRVLEKLRVRKLEKDRTRRPEVRDSARGFLAAELPYVCGQTVQDCPFRTPVLASVHVYDIPMQQWPTIMKNKGADLVEGCVLFPRKLFDLNSGEMRATGARYEVDVGGDRFRMGFIDSPSWWYEHKLSDYLKYGVDQVLSDGGATYSYKVVERRGDTLFFRILKVARRTAPNYEQHYRVPGVEMVRVNGFPVAAEKTLAYGGARRAYLFPRPLWEDMLGHAKLMVERGTLSHEKLFNYYRTVAPRQTINAVLVAGGSTVDDINQLVPLVVHVALFAFLEVRRTQIEALRVTGEAMAKRVLEQEYTLYKVLAAFGKSLEAVLKVTVTPLMMLARLLDMGAEKFHAMREFDWAVVPTVQKVSAKLVLPGCFSGDNSVVADFSDAYAAMAPADLVTGAVADSTTAAFVLDAFGDALPEELQDGLRKAVEAPAEVVAGKGEVGGAAARALPAIVEETVAAKQVAETDLSVTAVDEISAEEVERRRQSIREAIVECDSEASKSEAACADNYRDLLIGGTPNLKKMVSRREMFGNPECWFVSAGIIEKSLSGAPVDGFQHAAVFCPVPFDGSRLLPVVEEEFRGMSQGEYVERLYYKLPTSSYSGWVYTCDPLLIHNGPAISAALRDALHLPLDFKVSLNQGPPGCGKTSAIVKHAVLNDVVLVPVRKAARETAERLAKKGPEFLEMVKARVRTVDSYLVNRARSRVLKSLKSDRLLADEAFMTREGRWLAAAAHLGVSVVEAYGDQEQIPHVPRAECPKFHVKLRFQEEKASFLTYRCPPQLVACWGGVYNWRVRSVSQVVGKVEHVQSTVGRDVPHGCVMMGMYQADKRYLREKYANCGVPIQIMTVHESEGNTYEHVWLHRTDLRRRTDQYSLYDRQPYALVAMSRSTHSFVYVAPNLGDLVSKWIQLGRDPRRVNAAADVASAGESVEKK